MILLSQETVKNLPEQLLPMLVFSTDNASFFSFGVRAVKRSQYSHFMWAHRPGYFASQHLWFKEVPVEKFLKNTAVLKFWMIDFVPSEARRVLIQRIVQELSKPWWKTRYDLLAIFGQLIGWKKFHSPWFEICSEHAHYLKLVDSRYDLDTGCPAPSDVNNWLKGVSGYSVYGKYQIEE